MRDHCIPRNWSSISTQKWYISKVLPVYSLLGMLFLLSISVYFDNIKCSELMLEKCYIRAVPRWVLFTELLNFCHRSSCVVNTPCMRPATVGTTQACPTDKQVTMISSLILVKSRSWSLCIIVRILAVSVNCVMGFCANFTYFCKTW